MLETKFFGQRLFVHASMENNYLSSDGWSEGTVKNVKVYTIAGKKYKLLKKMERYKPLLSFERITRVGFGLVCCAVTFGYALKLKAIRTIFSGRQVVRVMEPVVDSVKHSDSKKKLIGESVSLADRVGVDIPPAWKLTEKLFGISPVAKDTLLDCPKLGNDQISRLLLTVPGLGDELVWNGKKRAEEFIVWVNSGNILRSQRSPELNNPANKQLVFCMQCVLCKINGENDLNAKKKLLKKLVESLKDCLPVTQGNVGAMHMDLTLKTMGFEQQVACFIAKYKETVFEQVIYELYPDMKDPDYAARHFNSPWEQFPHMKTGFLAVLGEKFGFDVTIANQDLKRNTRISKEMQVKFGKCFLSKISIPDIVKEFIVDVNGRHGQIVGADLMKWAHTNLSEPHAVLHDEVYEYPSYSPKYNEDYGPFLTENIAYTIFQTLGYIVLPLETYP